VGKEKSAQNLKKCPCLRDRGGDATKDQILQEFIQKKKTNKAFFLYNNNTDCMVEVTENFQPPSTDKRRNKMMQNRTLKIATAVRDTENDKFGDFHFCVTATTRI
jgi:hypothetical protein